MIDDELIKAFARAAKALLVKAAEDAIRQSGDDNLPEAERKKLIERLTACAPIYVGDS